MKIEKNMPTRTIRISNENVISADLIRRSEQK